jgi:hypothetical protein
MLPGFRFLFIAILLCMSTLVFGLGAASLFRSAHEEFANLPTWRAQPGTGFAQPPETGRPTLAMLRVEPPPPDQDSGAYPAPSDLPAAAAAQPAAVTADHDMTAVDPDKPAVAPDKAATGADQAPAGPEKVVSGLDKVAALSPAMPAEQKPEPPAVAPEPPPSMPAAPVASAAAPLESPAPEAKPAVQPEVTVATPATAPTPPAVVEAAAVEPPPSPAPAEGADRSADATSLKIAMLGGPAVTVEPSPARKATAEVRTAAEEARSAALIRHAQARRARRRRIARERAAEPTLPKPVNLGFFDGQPGINVAPRQN